MADAMDVCDRWPAIFDAAIADVLGGAGGSRGAGADGDGTEDPTPRHIGERPDDYARRLREAREENERRIRAARHGREVTR